MNKFYCVHPHGPLDHETRAFSPANLSSGQISIWLYREDAEAAQAWHNYNRIYDGEYFIGELGVPDEEWARLMDDAHDGIPPQPLEDFRDYLKSLDYSDAMIAEDFDDRLIIKKGKDQNRDGKKVRKH